MLQNPETVRYTARRKPNAMLSKILTPSLLNRSKRLSVCVLLFSLFLLFGPRFFNQGPVFLSRQAAELSSFIGDVDIRVASVKRIMPDSYQAGDIWYGTREPWNRDGTRLMFWEDNNSQNLVHGKYGLGVVWARVKDLTSWTTLSEYEAIRHPLNLFPYSYDGRIEWSPFAGEENIAYAARLSDSMLVRINVDTGAVEPIVSLKPDNDSTVNPALMRWTLQNTLIVLLNGPDSWANGSFEVDVQNKTRRYYDPEVYSGYWNLPQADLQRWPIVVSHGHIQLSPDHNLFGVYATGFDPQLTTWPGLNRVVNIPPGNHMSWRASNQWWIGDDFGIPSYEGLTNPTLATFNIYQCWITGKCTKIYQVVSAQDYYDRSSVNGFMNWPTTPLATVRTDGRQMVFTSTDGKYSSYDYSAHRATPWGYRGIFLADLVPVRTTSYCAVLPWFCQPQ
jgi:hypothetical protein